MPALSSKEILTESLSSQTEPIVREFSARDLVAKTPVTIDQTMSQTLLSTDTQTLEKPQAETFQLPSTSRPSQSDSTQKQEARKQQPARTVPQWINCQKPYRI